MLNIFALMLLVTAITGSVVTLSWAIVIRLTRKLQKIQFVYHSLKFVMLGYMIPLFFLIHYIQGVFFDGRDNFFPMISSNIFFDFKLIFRIYLLGVFLVLWVCLFEYIQLRYVCKKSVPATKEQIRVLKDVQKDLNIKKNIYLRTGYAVVSPFIWGMIRPTIYLPQKKLTTKDLYVIFYHELHHYKQRDYFWKPAFKCIAGMYWFSPFAWYALQQMRRWSEASCDANCCETKYNPKDYYNYLLCLEDDLCCGVMAYASMIKNNQEDLKWRIDCMIKHKKSNRKCAVGVSCLTVLIGLLAVVFTTNQVQASYNQYYESEIISNEFDDENENELEEYVLTAEEVKKLNIVQEVPLPYMPLGTRNINWSVGNGVTYVSAMFYPTNGGSVSVAVGVTPSGKTVSLGLLQPNGQMKYVNGSGNFSHTFSITQSGGHKLCIINNSGTTVTVSGFYAY